MDNIEIEKRNTLYTLKIPNLEVKCALLESLLRQHSKIQTHDILKYGEKLLEYIQEGNCEKIVETLGLFIPISNEIRGKDERYYYALLFMLLFSAKSMCIMRYMLLKEMQT